MASLVCVHLSLQSDIYTYIIDEHRVNNGIEGSQKNIKGYVGWVTYLHNLCWGDSIESPCFFYIILPYKKAKPVIFICSGCFCVKKYEHDLTLNSL